MEKPKQLNDQEIDFTKLRENCQSYIDYLTSDQYHEDNDLEHYVYEAAMEAIFGKSVWDFINKQIELNEYN